MNFFRISRQIPENSDVCRFFNQIRENKSEICRKFWILWKKFTIISELFTSLLSLHFLTTERQPRASGRPPAALDAKLWRRKCNGSEKILPHAGWRLQTVNIFESQIGQTCHTLQKR